MSDPAPSSQSSTPPHPPVAAADAGVPVTFTPPKDAKTSDASGRPARLSRRVRREQERQERHKQLTEMGKLAAGLAHELRNPLSTLKLNLQLMEEDLINLPGAQRSVTRLAVLKQEADRLRQTLDDFLQYAGRIELRPQIISLNAVIEELMDFLLPQAQANKVRVLTSLAPENPLCRLDVNLFKQALLNLLLNALQAMPAPGEGGEGANAADGGGGELFVRTLQSKDSAILYVSDTGIGVPTENLPHIFEAYFTTKKGGTGLGLPTTRRIIEEHNGHITVQSEPGKGTTFRVELPLANSANSASAP